MSNWRYSICDPLQAEIIEKGEVSAEDFIRVMETFPWEKELKKLNDAEKSGEKIYYSPSLELENKTNKHGISVSIIGTPDNYDFMVFYKRPKVIIEGGFFKKKEVLKEGYVSDRNGITLEEVHMIFEGLLEEDYNWLEENIG